MSTAQIHTRIGVALALSTCAHALVFITSSFAFTAATQPSPAQMLRISFSASGPQGIHPSLEMGERGFRKKQAQKNPPAPSAKGAGDKTPLSFAQQAGEGDFALSKSGGGPSPHDIVKPEYTQRARRQGVQGEVVLDVTLGPDGKVLSAKVTKGIGYGLDEAALEAILKSRFLPAQDADGKGVESQITYRFRFELTTQPNA